MKIKFNFPIDFTTLVMAITAMPAQAGSHFNTLITESTGGEFEIDGAEKVDSAQRCSERRLCALSGQSIYPLATRSLDIQ